VGELVVMREEVVQQVLCCALAACVRADDPPAAVRAYRLAVHHGLSPNLFCLRTLLRAFTNPSSRPSLDAVIDVYHSLQKVCELRGSHSAPDAHLLNCVLRACGQLGHIGRSLQFFDMAVAAGTSPDAVTVSELLRGCARDLRGFDHLAEVISLVKPALGSGAVHIDPNIETWIARLQLRIERAVRNDGEFRSRSAHAAGGDVRPGDRYRGPGAAAWGGADGLAELHEAHEALRELRWLGGRRPNAGGGLPREPRGSGPMGQGKWEKRRLERHREEASHLRERLAEFAADEAAQELTFGGRRGAKPLKRREIQVLRSAAAGLGLCYDWQRPADEAGGASSERVLRLFKRDGPAARPQHSVAASTDK